MLFQEVEHQFTDGVDLIFVGMVQFVLALAVIGFF